MLRQGVQPDPVGMAIELTEKISLRLGELQSAADRLSRILERERERTGEDAPRIDKVMVSIERHTRLLSGKVRVVNRFFQRIGQASSLFDLKELIEEAALFSARLAHLKRIAVTVQTDEDLPKFRSNPAGLHFLVSGIMARILTGMREGGTLLVKGVEQDGRALIQVEGKGQWKEGFTEAVEVDDLFRPVAGEIPVERGVVLSSETEGLSVKRVSLFLDVTTDRSPTTT